MNRNLKSRVWIACAAGLVVFAILAIFAACQPRPGERQALATPTPEPMLVYSELFSGSVLPSPWYACPIWYNCTTGGRVDQAVKAQAWMLGSQVIVPGDGYLHLRADFLNPPKSQDGLTYPYKSGYTQTGGYAYNNEVPKKWFTYGYFEARLKCPQMDGAWCAFWLWADPQGNSEIDITEILARETNIHNMNLHGSASWSRTYRMSSPVWEWHVYSVDWQPGYIAWYVDGVETGRYTGTAFNNRSLYMLLTYQLGGTWAGTVDTSKLPNDMLVDCVAVWTGRPAAPLCAGGSVPATNTPAPATSTPVPATATRTRTVTRTPLPPTVTPVPSLTPSLPPVGYPTLQSGCWGIPGGGYICVP